MHKYLFIVNEYDSANGICTKKIMNELIKKNHKVYCITNSIDGNQKKFIKDEITFYTVKPRLSYILNLKLKKNNYSTIKRKFLSFIYIIINKTSLFMSIPTWPLISFSYSNRIYRLAKKICDNEKIDCIIPIYSQIDSLIAAEKIKRELKNICYIPYFLDSLSGGYGPKIFSQNWTIKRGIKWEKKLLPNADKILMMQSSKEHYDIVSKEDNYYNKIVYTDLPLYIPIEYKNVFKKTDNNINIYYVGTLPNGIRNPKYFLELFSLINNSNIHLYFVGTENCKILNEYVLKDKRIHVIGKCSYEEALKYEKKADILLNIGNTNKKMTPSKIFEYMSFSKPIISTCPIVEEPSRYYLKNYPLSYFVLEYNECNLENAIKLEEFILKNYNKRVDNGEMKKNYVKNSPEYTSDEIIKTINKIKGREEV